MKAQKHRKNQSEKVTPLAPPYVQKGKKNLYKTIRPELSYM